MTTSTPTGVVDPPLMVTGTDESAYGGCSFAWFHISMPFGPGIPVGYINDGGHIKSQRSFLLSGLTSGSTFTRIVEHVDGFYTIGLWTDGSSGDALIVARANNDDQPIIEHRDKLGYRRHWVDELGKHLWAPAGTGNGGLTSTAARANDAASDLDLSREKAHVLKQGTADTFKTGQAATGSRPDAAMVGEGAQFYDKTLHKPIWSDGTNWRDAMANVV